MSAVVSDSNFENPRVCYGILSSSSRLPVAHTSPQIWHFAGPRSLPKQNLPAGLHVWVWFDASPSGIAPLNLAQRSPLRTFFLITIGVSPLTFTPMRRSTESFTELDNCLRPGDSVPARLQPSLVCW